ncbi:hypothetical protein ARMSODRAFT_1072303 [Armillaria solidipes]|uniref:Uncharacterized protein n=1 Tax=Armillaria solidipes TaxID=1076256 RepID=A0A2H3C6Q9_9AGAR|nr:hypothetical protein ARMSODRAFT_1072303 [Armillaria solidipes]
MYRVHKAKGVTKFLTTANFRRKDSELAEALFGSAHDDEELGGIHIEFQELVQFLTHEYIERFRNKAALETGSGVVPLKVADKISKALVKYKRFIGWETTPDEMAEVGEFDERKGEFEQALSKLKANEEELKKQKRTTQYILGRMMPSRMNVVATDEEIEAIRADFLTEMKDIADKREADEMPARRRR